MEYKVGTFCYPKETRISKINAYTLTYNADWPECVEFLVQAPNGNEAKKIAKKLRAKHEFDRTKHKEK